MRNVRVTNIFRQGDATTTYFQIDGETAVLLSHADGRDCFIFQGVEQKVDDLVNPLPEDVMNALLEAV